MAKKVQEENKSFFQSDIFFVSLLFCSCLLLYWQTTTFSFVWDDLRVHFVGNKDYRSGKFWNMWAKPYEGMYIPLSYSAWFFIKALSGGGKIPETFPMHFSNVMLHSLNVILLFLLLNRIFKKKPVALIGAFVFMLHPIQAEVVSWVSELRGLLSLSFLLSGLLLFHRYKSSAELNIKNYFVVFTLGTCALLSKPSTIVFPVLLILMDFFLFKGIGKKDLWFYSLMLLAFLPVAFLTSQVQPVAFAEMNYSTATRLFLPAFSFGFYLLKIIFPFSFSAAYGLTPIVIAEKNILLTIALLFFLFAIYKSISFWKTNPILSFIILFYIFSLLPTSGIITFYFQQFSNVADRFAYTGMIAVSIFVCYFTNSLLEISKEKIVYPLCALFLLGLGILNFKEQKKWKDDVYLWEDTTQKHPEQVKAWHNLAVAYLDYRNDLVKGLAATDRGITLDPNYDRIHFNRANILARTGKLTEAIVSFNRTIELNPKSALAYYNRALCLYQLKKYKSAKADFDEAERLDYTVNEDFRKALDSKLKNKKSEN